MVNTRTETLASVDSAWLRMDEPGNLMVINAVMMFDRPIAFETYRDLIARRLLTLPRLGQRVAKSILPFTAPSWEPDPDIDLNYHVRLAPLERADQASLQALVSELMTQPFDPRRPLWQFHFVPHYEEGSAVICRLHHCIGDGLAMMYVLLTMTDTPPPTRDEAQGGEPRRSVLDFLTRSLSPIVSFTRSVEESVLREVKEIASRPAHALETTRDLSNGASSVGKLALMSDDPQTLFKGPLSQRKRAVWSQPVPVEALKEVARVTGSKINDVALAAVAGGLRRYLLGRGQGVGDITVRAVVPVNLRPIEQAHELGNRFGLVFVPLPIGIDDPLDRIFAVRANTQQIKGSPEALLTFQILRTLGVTPSPLFETIVSLFGRRATAVMTNVIGPREPLRFAGAQMKQVMFWVPCSGRLGMGVSIFSYTGNLWVGIATDASLVPDPERIIDGFHGEIAQMLQLAAQAKQNGSAGAGETTDPSAATPAAPAPSPAEREAAKDQATDAVPGGLPVDVNAAEVARV